MTVTIHTTGTHTITLADGSVSTVAFESTRTVDVVPPEVPVPIPPAGAHADHTLPEPERPISTAGLTVVITLDGVEHAFSEEGGQDLGNYTDPQGRFEQRCIRATCDTLPGFSVMFRPDAHAGPDGVVREEVVFELGAIWPTQSAANLGAYTATIIGLLDEPLVIDVPHHNWFGRWRWQSSSRPVTAQVADLIAAGLLPHYDTSVGGGYTQPSQQRHYAGPMDLAGITPYMPQTGGRDDIGLVTECQGDYLCTRSASALSSLLAQLEGSGTLTWHYRDENTGAPVDTEQYPLASSYDQWNSDPYIPWQVGDGGGITLDTSHEPDLAYVPFLLTGDPYALEELQFAVTYNVIKQPPNARNTYNMGGALRAHAWALRTMAHAAKATPEFVPGWLLPRTYFQRMLDGNRDYVASLAASPGTNYAKLSCMGDPDWGAPAETNIPPDCSNAPWWEDYEQTVMGHLIEMGFSDWLPNYEWKIRNIIDRCSGESGWVRNSAFPYKIALRETAQAPFVADWRECWELNVRMGVVADAGEDHIPAGDLSYPQQGLAALAIAKGYDIAPGVQGAHAWLRGEIERLSTSQSFVYHRWSIA